MKIKIICLWIAVVCLCTSGCSSQKTGVADLEEIAVEGSYQQLNYKGLQQEAYIIAKVKILNDIREKNSTVMKDPTEEYILGFYGERTAEVIEYYKDASEQYSPKISFVEEAAIIDGKYVHMEGYDTLKKGEEYILYLGSGKDTDSGKMGLLSCNNGVIELDDLEKNEDTAIKTLIKYESELEEKEKNNIVNGNITVVDRTIKSDMEVKLTEEKNDCDVNISIKEKEEGTYIVTID